MFEIKPEGCILSVNVMKLLHLSCEVTLLDLFPAWTWWILSAMSLVVCHNEVQA